MVSKKERQSKCALCGKGKDQTYKLIVGLDGAVCSACVDLCNGILGKNAQGTNGDSTVVQPTAVRVSTTQGTEPCSIYETEAVSGSITVHGYAHLVQFREWATGQFVTMSFSKCRIEGEASVR